MSTKRATGRLRALITSAAAAAALSVCAGGAQAAVMEEITVHGTLAAARAQQAEFEAQMAAYARSVESALREAVRENLERAADRRRLVAQAIESHRG